MTYSATVNLFSDNEVTVIDSNGDESSIQVELDFEIKEGYKGDFYCPPWDPYIEIVGSPQMDGRPAPDWVEELLDREIERGLGRELIREELA